MLWKEVVLLAALNPPHELVLAGPPFSIWDSKNGNQHAGLLSHTTLTPALPAGTSGRRQKPDEAHDASTPETYSHEGMNWLHAVCTTTSKAWAALKQRCMRPC